MNASILTKCAHCQKKYRVTDDALGKRAKCANCGQGFLVYEIKGAAGSATVSRAAAQSASISNPANERARPSVATPRATSKSRSPLTSQELFAGFREPFPRARPKLSYRFGLVLASLTMVVLPLVYVAFIALVGFGIYYHASNYTSLLGMGYGRIRIFAVLAYAAPIIAGLIAIFFMLKPLLARPSGTERSRSLRRESEPLLFEFIDRICEEVGAPRPARIDVDCTINASAGFRRGLFSILRQDLVLTIGLPLAAGLSLREFGGVMAHELGHFAQGLGMRLSYMVRAIVDWFIRVVYQRDQWDIWLDQIVEDVDIRIGWIFLVAKLFVAVGRGLLWVLLHIGLTISGIVLRLMEYDADRYEVCFAGSSAFASTVRKLHLLAGASHVAQLQLSASLDYRQLVDNLPGLMVYHARRMAPEALPHIEQMINESTTGWFDSHPCDKDRISAAKFLASPGIFRSDRPAGDLFTDFNAQAAAATWDLYLGFYGPKVPKTALQPLAEFIAVHGQGSRI